MAAGTKVAAFGAMLRLFYVAFGSDRWTWQPMMWVVAILTMLVGAVLAIAQTDVKRMLAYSSIAHTGFLLTGVLGVQSSTDLAIGQLTSLQAVLFYLVTYGFATMGAFAVVTLVRDAGGEQTHLARWAGLGKESPLVAGVFAFFLLAMAGIPLTSGFVGKWAVFASALSAGAYPVVVVAILSSIIAAFFYVRVIRLMYFTEPGGEAPSVTNPSVLTGCHDRDRRGGHAGPRRRPRPRARPGRTCGRVHQVTPSPAPGGLALPVTDAALADRLQRRMLVVEDALYGHVVSRTRYVTEAASHLLAAGGKRFRPLLVLLAAEAGPRPESPEVIDAACVVELTHVGSLYHDDVMDEAALRRGADSANARWDNHVAILTGDFLFAKSSELTAGLGPEAVRIQAETFARLVEGQILETVPPGEGEDPLAHYLDVVAGKTGSLIATSARYGARFSGAPAAVEEALTAYGEIVGSAFQLSDDILDIASETDESGKTPGTDLREGVPTLPVLMARALCRRRPTRPTPGCSSCSTATSPTAPSTPRRWPAAPAPRDGPGPRLRRGACPRGQAAADRAPRGPGPGGAGVVRRHRRHAHRVTDPSDRDGLSGEPQLAAAVPDGLDGEDRPAPATPARTRSSGSRASPRRTTARRGRTGGSARCTAAARWSPSTPGSPRRRSRAAGSR